MAFNTTVKTHTTIPSESIDMDEYYRQSAEKCFCRNCCTCHCCGLFILICWIIFGIWGAYNAYIRMDTISDGWMTSDPCSFDNYNNGGPCCIGYTDHDIHFQNSISKYITNDEMEVAFPGSCEKINTAYTIAMVQNILCCLSGVAGTVGLMMFISWLLLIPLAYSILSVILNIIVLIILGFGVFIAGYAGCVVAVFIAILFYMNWKIMRDTVNT
eukprot:273641_1